jgi:hypothetical protein
LLVTELTVLLLNMYLDTYLMPFYHYAKINKNKIEIYHYPKDTTRHPRFSQLRLLFLLLGIQNSVH